MSEQTRRVLELVAQGKVTPADAEELLDAMRVESTNVDSTGTAETTGRDKPRYVRIAVHKVGREGRRSQDVNIKVPLRILRSGLRLGALIPGLARERMHAKLREQGIDIDLAKIDPAMIESLLKDLGEVNIDVNEGEEQVRITCE